MKGKNAKIVGIRVIGIFFLFWAISNLMGLITGTNSSKGFLGFSVGFTGITPYSFDIMAWIGVYILAYAGYHLVMLNPQGRTWALIVLWPSVISGLFLIFITISSLIFSGSLSMTFKFLDYSFKIDKPVFLLAISGIAFLFYAVQIYFLMNKDVKIEFKKQEASKEVS